MNAETAADYKYQDVTDAVIAAFYCVYNFLGQGFLEKVYVNSLVHELEKRGLQSAVQQPISVFYDGRVVGEYYADIIVDNRVIVEVKAARALIPEHEAQLLNYLRATDKEVGLLLNFGPKPHVMRKAFNNNRKSRNIDW